MLKFVVSTSDILLKFQVDSLNSFSVKNRKSRGLYKSYMHGASNNHCENLI